MTTQPQPGQYWGVRQSPAVRIIGFDGDECIVRHRDGRLTTLAKGNWQRADGDWQHLPDCDSFDWVPEVWPKYVFCDKWNLNEVAYLRRDSPDMTTYVKVDGTEERYSHQALVAERTQSGDWTYITEAEAKARINPPQPPDPGEGWRLIDKSVDEPQEGDEQLLIRGQWRPRSYPRDPFLEPGIYRRRLEPPKPRTRTVVFHEHVVWDEVGDERLVWCTESDLGDLAWDYRHPTGETRTIEVPE